MRLDSGKASGKELERSLYVSFRVSGRSVYGLVLNSVHP